MARLGGRSASVCAFRHLKLSMKIDASNGRSTAEVDSTGLRAALENTYTSTVYFFALLPCQRRWKSSMARKGLANPVDSQLISIRYLLRSKKTLELSIWPSIPNRRGRVHRY
ncbi:hypothetical protein B0H13DRAFT_1887187 [Mycena leptocephala]|nr:hypothetical protein B0H13DRAFT_1887187 [Mycena leptocephala]